MSFSEIGPDGEPQTCHDRSGVNTLSGHVPNCEGKVVMIYVDKTEPISADLHSVSTGDIPRRNLQIGNRRVALGQKCLL